MSARKGNSVSTAQRRLMSEYKSLIQDTPEGISAGPIDEDNFFEWECLIQGPEDTPYDGGLFAATLSFPAYYPRAYRKMKSHKQYLPSQHLQRRYCVHLDFASTW